VDSAADDACWQQHPSALVHLHRTACMPSPSVRCYVVVSHHLLCFAPVGLSNFFFYFSPLFFVFICYHEIKVWQKWKVFLIELIKVGRRREKEMKFLYGNCQYYIISCSTAEPKYRSSVLKIHHCCEPNYVMLIMYLCSLSDICLYMYITK